jgi:FecR protein
MLQRKNSIATSAWVLALAIVAGVCQAQSIGTVTDLQGILLSRNAAGTIKILAPNSSIESGDRLLTRPGTYARMAFTDGTAVTLGPESELAILQYSYSDTAHSNSAVLDFVQGRLEIAAGRLGARSVDRFVLNTSIGTIVVGRATFIAGFTTPPRAARLHVPVSPWQDRDPSADLGLGHFENVVYHPPNASPPRLLLAQNIPATAPNGLNPGLYVQVLDGAIHVANGGGTQNFTAGQFGYTPGFQQPPVILPSNPGLQFTPPPSFSSTTGAAGGTSGSKPGDVDCVVR